MNYRKDKYGNEKIRSRGPFDQAKQGIYSVVDSLREKIDDEHKHLKDVFFSYGVMFPDMKYTANGIDELQWQIFDRDDIGDVKAYIHRLIFASRKRWEDVYGALSQSRLPSKADIRYLASLLRGDFDYVLPMKLRLENIEQALIELTQEQYRCLDQLEDNARCLIQGFAGTGKTLLALEAAKKAAACGEKVAFFCFNTRLAEWLEKYFTELAEEVQPEFVGTFHKYLFQVINDDGVRVPYPDEAEKINEYYQKTLPVIANEILNGKESCFDRIIIDEAQDLISDYYIQVLNSCLKRGFSRGKWMLFGDFTMQTIYSEGVSESGLIENLEKYASFARFKLTVNCRNTKQICTQIQTVTGLKIAHTLERTIDGPPVEYITWSSINDQCDKLEKILDKLKSNGIPFEKITILSPQRRENSVISLLTEYDIKDFNIYENSNLMFSTIHAYKGLENTVIILIDIDNSMSSQLLYVGLSRATSSLYVLLSETAKKDLLLRGVLQWMIQEENKL